MFVINSSYSQKQLNLDVDNDLSEITFYGQLPNETVNADMDITDDQQSLIFYLNNIQTAGLFGMSICATCANAFKPASVLPAPSTGQSILKRILATCSISP